MIKQISLKNYGPFKEFEIGFEGGVTILPESVQYKSAVIEAISVAAGSWLLGIRGCDSRHIRLVNVPIVPNENSEDSNWSRIFPVSIAAEGNFLGQEVAWTRSMYTEKGRTNLSGAEELRQLAEGVVASTAYGDVSDAPFIGYYDCNQWSYCPHRDVVKSYLDVCAAPKASRFSAYRNGLEPRWTPLELTAWMGRHSWVAFQKQGRFFPTYLSLKETLLFAADTFKDIYFDPEIGEIVGCRTDEQGAATLPFSAWTDSERFLVGFFGDIAHRILVLNHHLSADALSSTDGVVLVDNLGVNISMRDQKRIVGLMEAAFPQIQFICATNSPLVQGETIVEAPSSRPEQENPRPLSEWRSNWPGSRKSFTEEARERLGQGHLVATNTEGGVDSATLDAIR